LTDHSTWWPKDDGGVSCRFIAAPEDADALHELADVLCAGLDLELELAEPGDEPVVAPDGDGLTFDELKALLQRRRGTATDQR
jgi:hypothetical protein